MLEVVRCSIGKLAAPPVYGNTGSGRLSPIYVHVTSGNIIYNQKRYYHLLKSDCVLNEHKNHND